jgi:hypothetical protein
MFSFRRYQWICKIWPIFAMIFSISGPSHAQVFIPFSNWKGPCLSYVNNIDNNIISGFGAGTLTNVSWSGSALVLNAAQTSGTYVSPPFNFTDCYNAPLKYLAWTSILPFGKEVPSTSETSFYYSGITAGLTTNLVGLWHLNETAGTTFVDSAGTGNTGNKQGNVTLGVTGKLLNAATFDGATAYISTTKTFNNPTLFTVAIWFKTVTAAGGHLIGMGNAITGSSGNYDRHLYMTNAGKIYFGVYPNAVRVVTTPLSYNDGVWHQAVGTLSAAGLQLYMDGVLISTDAATTTAQSYTGYIRIGYDSVGGWTNQPSSYFFNGTLDEAAFWTRALSGTEVQQLYQRGGNRLKFQIRQCTQVTCSDNPSWQGPDGTASTFFTEINNNSNQNLSTGTVQTVSPNLIFSNFPSFPLANTNAFQYQIIFETDNTTYLPSVGTVIVNH